MFTLVRETNFTQDKKEFPKFLILFFQLKPLRTQMDTGSITSFCLLKVSQTSLRHEVYGKEACVRLL